MVDKFVTRMFGTNPGGELYPSPPGCVCIPTLCAGSQDAETWLACECRRRIGPVKGCCTKPLSRQEDPEAVGVGSE
jgi:hypothetical protein